MIHTIESLQDKTPKELTQILRELLGWREVDESYELISSGERVKRISFYDPSGKWHNADMLPPYATSYDAIMPEVTRLDGRQRDYFCEQLERITEPQWTANIGGIGVSWRIDWALITASPADLTRALILTKQTNEEME